MPLDENRNYTPPAVSGYFPQDLYNVGAALPKHSRAQSQAMYSARIVDKIPGEGDIIQWKLQIDDVRGGLNCVTGHFQDDFDRISSGDADGRFYHTLILPQLTTNATSPDPGGNLRGIHSVNLYDTLIIGAGSTANSCLFTETSATDPTIIAKTYTPTSSITGLTGVVIGGATSTQRLAVCRSGDPPQILDSGYAVVNTMHANLDNSWGMIQTFINDDLILIYANNTLSYLDKTSAITDAPTVGLSNVPNGGYALGMAKLAGAPIRPYWVWPYENNNSGMLLFGSERPGHVVSTNQEGTDYQEIPLGLKYVFSACIVNESAIVASDKERVVLYDGRSAPRDLTWIGEREPDSDKVYECRGLFANGSEVWIEVNKKASTNGTGSTERFWEVYNIETNAWHKVSASQTLSSTGSFGLLPGGALPYSKTTGFTHVYSDGAWRRIFVPVYGYNPFTLYRQTSGAQSNTGNEYEASATYTSPKFELPGLEGWPKVVSRILFLGDVDAGGTASTAATVSVSAGNMTAVFGTGLSNRAQLMDVIDNNDLFYKLQVGITLNRTTNSTRFTPNGLPVIIEGYAFVQNGEPPWDWRVDER